MASVASQLIEEVTAHAQSDSLEDAQEARTDGTYFPNNLCTNLNFKNYIMMEVFLVTIQKPNVKKGHRALMKSLLRKCHCTKCVNHCIY